MVRDADRIQHAQSVAEKIAKSSEAPLPGYLQRDGKPEVSDDTFALMVTLIYCATMIDDALKE